MHTQVERIWHLGREVLARLTYELHSGVHGYTETKLVSIEELPEESTAPDCHALKTYDSPAPSSA